MQAQRLTQQQMLVVHLLEMPLTELEQSVTAEIDDNPALESGAPEDAREAEPAHDAADDGAADEDFDAAKEREERASALDDALAGIGMDDEMPEPYSPGGGGDQGADYEERTYGDQTSFYDRLREQMVDVDLTPKQREIMEYLIGSLDDDGLLRKDAGALSDELAVYHNVDADIFCRLQHIAYSVRAHNVSYLVRIGNDGRSAVRERYTGKFRRRDYSAFQMNMRVNKSGYDVPSLRVGHALAFVTSAYTGNQSARYGDIARLPRR